MVLKIVPLLLPVSSSAVALLSTGLSENKQKGGDGADRRTTVSSTLAKDSDMSD